MSEQITVIGYRVVDMLIPHVDSIKRPCEDCERDVWVAKQQLMKPDMTISEETKAVCIQCFKTRLDNESDTNSNDND